MREASIAVSVALLIVWMQRKKRWALFYGAMIGQYAINTDARTGAVPPPLPANEPDLSGEDSTLDAAVPSLESGIPGLDSGGGFELVP